MLGNQPPRCAVLLQYLSVSWPRTASFSGNLGDFSGCLDLRHLLFGVSITQPMAGKLSLETSNSSGTHEVGSLQPKPSSPLRPLAPGQSLLPRSPPPWPFATLLLTPCCPGEPLFLDQLFHQPYARVVLENRRAPTVISTST